MKFTLVLNRHESRIYIYNNYVVMKQSEHIP